LIFIPGMQIIDEDPLEINKEYRFDYC